MGLTPTIVKPIRVAITLQIISGLGLTLEGVDYFGRTVLIAKHALIAVLITAGFILVFVLVPKMQSLVPKGGPPSAEFLAIKKKVMTTGMLNTVLWYAIFVLSFTI